MSRGVSIAPGGVASLDALGVDALVLPFFAEVAQPQGAAGYVDWRLSGRLARLLRGGRFVGEAGDRVLMSALGRVDAERIFLFGLGDADAPPKRRAALVEAMVDALDDAGARVVAFAPPVSRARDTALEGALAFLDAIAARRAKVERVVLIDDAGALEAARVELARRAEAAALPLAERGA